MSSEQSSDAFTGPLAEADLGRLVADWLDWDAAGDLLGVSASRVRALVKEHQLASGVPVAGEGPRVPALFIDDDGEIVKGLPGLLTVLHDGGYDDHECIAWIFIDADLPGRPIDALRENRGAEVKRRAQSMAF